MPELISPKDGIVVTDYYFAPKPLNVFGEEKENLTIVRIHGHTREDERRDIHVDFLISDQKLYELFAKLMPILKSKNMIEVEPTE